MLRTTTLSLALLLVLMPVSLIEKTGASQPDFEEFLDAGSFAPPVSGLIRYSSVPVDSGAAFDASNPQTWYTMVWAGRYSGPAAQRAEHSGGHPGVDIRDRYGEMSGDLGVYAIADGVVIRRRNVSGWGNFIAIRHDNVTGLGTIYSVYAHLDDFDPSITNGQEGQIRVTRGQRIGTMGSTGLGDPAARHLHFQIDKAWPEGKGSPFWPTYTSAGNVSPYPTGDDSGLTESQLQEAAQDVSANTASPMWLVETGSITDNPTHPEVSVSPDCGPAGTLFSLEWTGFTPNSTLTSHLQKPDGTEFPTFKFNTDSQGRASFIIDSSTFVEGTYQHWAEDDATGGRSNAVFILVSAPSEGVSAITFGENINLWDADDGKGQLFEFCGSVFDVVSIELNGGHSGLLLADPTGVEVARNDDSPARIYAQLLRAGEYTIAAWSTYGTNIYGLSLQRVNNPGFARPIRCGQSLLSILQARQRQTFTFHGSPNDQVTITVRRGGSGEVRPYVELYDPSGIPLAIEQTGGEALTISGITLSAEGSYTVLVSDTWDHSGSYTITVTCR